MRQRPGLQRLVWVDRSGNIVGEGLEPADAPGWTFRLSPSGDRLAVGGRELGVLDLDRGVFQRLPTSPEGAARLWPAWSPDELRIAYMTDDLIRIVAVDGTSDEELIRTDAAELPLDWSPDGSRILFSHREADADRNYGLWLASVSDGSSEPWLSGDANYGEGCFSPNGRWVAYRSDETGVSEVYVRPFPGPGSPTRVSLAGGGAPAWSGDGKELYFLTLEGSLMAVEVDDRKTLTISEPRELIAQAVTPPSVSHTNYLVTADGKRFLTTQRAGPGPAELIQGWTNLLPK